MRNPLLAGVKTADRTTDYADFTDKTCVPANRTTDCAERNSTTDCTDFTDKTGKGGISERIHFSNLLFEEISKQYPRSLKLGLS
jgi:hypothetical protein